MKTNLDRIKRDIEELSKSNATLGQGLTRFSLTAEDRGAREYIKDETSKLGVIEIIYNTVLDKGGSFK